MQNRQFLKAKMAATLLIAALCAQASASWVYFHNDSGASGMVDVYVDGRPVFTNIPPDNFMMFPRAIEAGQHEIVVTRHGQAPGLNELAHKMMEVQYANAYTLKLGMNNGPSDPTNVAVSMDIRSPHR